MSESQDRKETVNVLRHEGPGKGFVSHSFHQREIVMVEAGSIEPCSGQRRGVIQLTNGERFETSLPATEVSESFERAKDAGRHPGRRW